MSISPYGGLLSGAHNQITAFTYWSLAGRFGHHITDSSAFCLTGMHISLLRPGVTCSDAAAPSRSHLCSVEISNYGHAVRGLRLNAECPNKRTPRRLNKV